MPKRRKGGGVATPKKKHGTRYTSQEKKKILAYKRSHTWAQTSAKYGVSQQTLARWSLDN